MPPFFTARGRSPNSAIARAADNLGYHRGSCGCSRSNRTVYSPRILFRRAGVGFWTDVAIVAGVTLLAIIAHMVEIAIWAVLFNACGEFTGLAPAFYHSAMNYTSLGYGDVVMSVSSRLLGPLEAATARLYQLRSKMMISPAAGKCSM